MTGPVKPLRPVLEQTGPERRSHMSRVTHIIIYIGSKLGMEPNPGLELMTLRSRPEQRHRQREKQAPRREPDVGLQDHALSQRQTLNH